MTDLVRLNDTILSWNSLIWKIDNIPYNSLRSMDVGDARERPFVFGGRRDGRPLGRPSGKYVPDPCKMALLADSAMVILAYLSVKGLGSYGDGHFTMTVQASEPVPSGVGPPVQTTLLEDCVITKVHDPFEQDGELVREFEFSTMQVTRNGMRLWSVVKGVTV